MRRWLSSPFGVLELIMGVYLLMWGFWTASPWWSSYTSTPSFRIVASLFPAWAVGGTPMLVAILLAVAEYTGWHKLRHVALFAVIGYYLFLSFTFGLSNPAAGAWIVHLMTAFVFAFLLFANMGRES